MLFLWYNGWPIVTPAGWPVPFLPRGKTTTGGISFVGDDVEPVFILEALPGFTGPNWPLMPQMFTFEV